MKFTIELYATATDGSETLLYRVTISALNPAAAQKQAAYLLSKRKKGAGARVLNAQSEIIYQIKK
jgi:hypothetical protein